jgi:hypothetical protein
MARKKTNGQPPAPAAPPLRLEWRDPAELAEHPMNWKTHPEAQVVALTDAIAQVGWAGACLLNERTGRLLDGHARRKVALAQGGKKVPVLVGAWSDEQERLILATLDPLGALAEADGPALEALLLEVQTDSPALLALLDSLRPAAPDEPAPPDEFGAYDESIPTEHQCPKCGYRWSGKSEASDE